jgi:hypothetical protein
MGHYCAGQAAEVEADRLPLSLRPFLLTLILHKYDPTPEHYEYNYRHVGRANKAIAA